MIYDFDEILSYIKNYFIYYLKYINIKKIRYI